MTDEMLDPAAEWAGLLLTSLADAGIRDLVLSPGSRSTPLVLAAVRGERFRITEIIDERAAAFFALGQARASGRPSLLVCTSGSAAAHYLPAIVEAAYAYLPLLVLTADRPLDLQACAAPQTIDQLKLYGGFVRGFFELGQADTADEALLGLRRMATQAVALAHHPTPGAVHLNVRARKPLEPHAASAAEAPASRRIRAVAAQPITMFYPPQGATAALPAEAALAALVGGIETARRGLIVCGPGPLAQAQARADVQSLAARSGLPVCVEATSQLRFVGRPACSADADSICVCDGFDALFGIDTFRRTYRPDFILQLGAVPTSSGMDRYLSLHANASRFVVAPYGWPDPQQTATALIHADIGATARAIAARLQPLAGRPDAGHLWRERFRTANRLTWQTIAELVDDAASDELSEAAVARTVAAAMPSDAVLMVGNSLPIRTLDRFCPATQAHFGVVAQRGANGIDGLVAGAAGLAACRQPTTLVLGDISLLHDLGALAVAARVTVPLIIVVVNNRGGRIFEQLPLGHLASQPEIAAALPYFTTPHAIEFHHAAALFGLAFDCVDTPAALGRTLATAQRRASCTLIEARVSPHNAATLDAALSARLTTALTEAGLLHAFPDAAEGRA